MADSSLREFQRQIHRTQILIWVAFMTACPIYLVVAYVLVSGRALTGPPENFQIFLMIMTALALMSAVGSIVYRRYSLSDQKLRAKLKEQAGTGPSSEDIRMMGGAKIEEAYRELSSDDRKSGALLVTYMQSMIVAWAFNEAIAIYGMLLVVMGGPIWYLLPFLVASVGLNLMSRPMIESFLEHAEGLVRRVEMGI